MGNIFNYPFQMKGGYIKNSLLLSRATSLVTIFLNSFKQGTSIFNFLKNKISEWNQYILKSHFEMVLFQLHIVINGFWQHA